MSNNEALLKELTRKNATTLERTAAQVIQMLETDEKRSRPTKVRHEGKSLHRLNDNPLERAYHDAWLKENTPEGPGLGGDLLGYLLGDNNKRGEVSERDALVAATVIQWLGSPVGQRFVENVLATQPA